VECQLTLRRTQRELQRSYHNLRELEQLRDSLVHMIVHDMRSPLQVLVAQGFFLKQALSRCGLSEVQQDVDALVEAAERLETMANTVLDVSRLEAGRMPLELANHDLNGLVRDVVRRMRPLFPDRQVTIVAPELAAVQCDGKLLYRVIENLVSNGLKHTPPAHELRISVQHEASGVRVAVDDEGPGVPPELRERIFEKFGGVASPGMEGRATHSVGLGLAMCRLAIAAHGGKIGVDSAPVRGSRFWFTLPLVAAAA
jgi:two-component system sensor histidine kinase/response regulator